jgi:hypothetical protein
MPRNKCTKCNRPTRGHSGPVDDDCILPEAPDNYGQGSLQDVSFDWVTSEQDKSNEANGGANADPPIKKRTPQAKPDAAFAMKELLLQMGHLSCTVQRMSDEQKALTTTQKLQGAELLKLKANPATPTTNGPPAQHGQQPARLPPAYDPQPLPLPAADDGASRANQQGINPSLELPIALPNGARISRKTMLAAKSGDYINLPEIDPNSEPSAIMESVIDDATGQIVFKSKSVKKAIDCFLSWARAWAGYESLLITMTPSLYQSLSDYRLFIQSCDATYHWPAVTSYDMRHRHRTSMSHSLDFTICSTDIYVVTLNVNTIRPTPKSCYNCGSLDHNIKDCPFQKPASRNQSQAPTPRKSFPPTNSNPRPNVSTNFIPRTDSQAYGGDRQVLCYNWNNGRCTSPACWRAHICSVAGVTPPKAKSFLHPHAWAHILSQHPNQCYAMLLNDYIKNGVPIMYTGPELTLVSPNWKSTELFKNDVLLSIEKDISLGRKSSPFTSIPCNNFRSSPLGAFAKKHSTKVRVIHDLYWPPDLGVNTFIPSDICSVSYIRTSRAGCVNEQNCPSGRLQVYCSAS